MIGRTLGVFAVHVLLAEAWIPRVKLMQLRQSRLQPQVKLVHLATQVDDVLGPVFAVEVERALQTGASLGNDFEFLLLQG